MIKLQNSITQPVVPRVSPKGEPVEDELFACARNSIWRELRSASERNECVFWSFQNRARVDWPMFFSKLGDHDDLPVGFINWQVPITVNFPMKT